MNKFVKPSKKPLPPLHAYGLHILDKEGITYCDFLMNATRGEKGQPSRSLAVPSIPFSLAFLHRPFRKKGYFLINHHITTHPLQQPPSFSLTFGFSCTIGCGIIVFGLGNDPIGGVLCDTLGMVL